MLIKNNIVVPAWIAETQEPRTAIYKHQTHPCVLDTGNPCRYDGLTP
ncbi:MAG: hypothetical protein HOO93_03620 [Methyloglobulus sp.]|nr:hypothetical protein [Methyloglobulus sp.]